MKFLFIIPILALILLLGNIGFPDSFADEQSCDFAKPLGLEYSIEGAKINKICLDQDAPSLIITLESFGEGMVTLNIPRIIYDAKQHECVDGYFFVLINGEEINFEETKNDKFRALTIPINKGDKELEVIAALPSVMTNPKPSMADCQKSIQQKFRPLEQVKYGIPPDEIRCKEDLVFVFKNYLSTACVKETSVIPLMVRGWAEIYNFEITKGFPEHNIVGAEIESMTFDALGCGWFDFEILSQEEGELIITIPLEIFDFRTAFEGDYSVLVNGEEVNFEEEKYPTERILIFSLPLGTETIRINPGCPH